MRIVHTPPYQPRGMRENRTLSGPPMRLNQLPCGGTRTHDQDENDTRSMALCQSLLRLRDASKAALIVVHHVRSPSAVTRLAALSAALRPCTPSATVYLLLARPSAETRQ